MVTNLSIDPTYLCNENCISCRCNLIARSFDGKARIPIEKYYSLIDEFKNMGGESISIFGGEPLLVREIFDILSYAKKKSFKTSITTNGTLLERDEICKKLKNTGVDSITISIMAVGDSYGVLHGKNYFGSLVNAMTRISENKYDIKNKVCFHMTLQRLNFEQLIDIVRLAIELGVKHVSCQYVSITTDSDNYKTEEILGEKFESEISHWKLPNEILIQEQNVERCLNSIYEALIVARKNGIDLNLDPVFLDEKAKKIMVAGYHDAQGCCDLSDLILMPDGRVGACAMLQHFVIGDIFSESLSDIINSKRFVKLKDFVENGKLLPVCKSCCKHAMFYKEKGK